MNLGRLFRNIPHRTLGRKVSPLTRAVVPLSHLKNWPRISYWDGLRRQWVRNVSHKWVHRWNNKLLTKLPRRLSTYQHHGKFHRKQEKLSIWYYRHLGKLLCPKSIRNWVVPLLRKYRWIRLKMEGMRPSIRCLHRNPHQQIQRVWVSGGGTITRIRPRLPPPRVRVILIPVLRGVTTPLVSVMKYLIVFLRHSVSNWHLTYF